MKKSLNRSQAIFPSPSPPPPRFSSSSFQNPAKRNSPDVPIKRYVDFQNENESNL